MSQVMRFSKFVMVWCLGFFIVACTVPTQKDVVSIEIDTTTVSEFYTKDNFHLEEILLIVHYDDGSRQTMPLDLSMFNTDDHALFETVGTHELVLSYQGFETSLSITIVMGEETYTITFDSRGGS